MLRACAVLFFVFACLPANAWWGVAADFADRKPEVSGQAAQVLTQGGVDCFLLDTNGTNSNWPMWMQVLQTLNDAGVSTVWTMPSSISACEHILGFEQGTFELDDRPLAEDGSRIGTAVNFFDPQVAYQLTRASKAVARRLKNAAGYRISPGHSPHVSYDAHARADWQKFLAQFFADDTPAEDTNHDSCTFNTAYAANYSKWEEVELFSVKEREQANMSLLTNMWLGRSWAAFIDTICAELKPIDRGTLLGPGVQTLLPSALDISMLASSRHIDVIYADSPSLAAFTAVFAKKVVVAPGSINKALEALPFASSALFDSSDVMEIGDDNTPSLRPAFENIPKLAPFAGKFKVEWTEALWIVPGLWDSQDIVDSHCVTESTLAVDPDCVDFTHYKAVIYKSDGPCASLAIMQKLFNYALNGGTVFIDANRVASGPSLHGRDNALFWLKDMERHEGNTSPGSTTITFSDITKSFDTTAPYLTCDESKLQTAGKVESGEASYPLVMVRKIGESGKWVYINWPLIWQDSELLNKIVKDYSGVALPDLGQPRIYSGENCAMAIGGEGSATIEYPDKQAAVFDVMTGEARVVTAKDGNITLAESMKRDERRLWVVKPYGQPVVLYTDGTTNHSASIDDGEYSNGKLRFKFAEKAWISSPTQPESLTINGQPAPFEYDEEQHLITITRTGKTAAAELEFTMAKTFATKGYNDDDIILLLNLQGLVNRDGARLFYDTEGRNDWGPSDRRWMEIYNERKGIGFEPVESLDELITEFKDSISGLVVYDPKLDASRYVALTLAGINGWLAVSPDQIKGEIANIPVKEDLRGRWTDGVQAYEWAIENLRPQCSDNIAYSAGQSHDDVNLGHDPGIILALDYAIGHKGFVFNLSPCPEPATYDYEKEQVKGHPEDVRLMDKIYSTYKAPAKIYGWDEPEWKFTSRISKAGHMLMCGRGANLSFHQHVPSDMKQFKQTAETDPKPKPIEDKYYIAFMTNEGDTPRVITTFMFGAWEDPNRGKLPISWGISPTLIVDFPALAEYYYSTATHNDYFYAGVSGTGYAFIDQLPDIANFARYGAPNFKASDIDIVDSWDEFEFHPKLYETYAKEASIKLFTLLPRGESGPKLLPSGVPVFIPHGKVHYKETGFDDRMEGIKAVTEEHKPPFIIPLYGGVTKTAPSDYLKIAEALGKENFEVITLAQMAWMAKEIAGK